MEFCLPFAFGTWAVAQGLGCSVMALSSQSCFRDHTCVGWHGTGTENQQGISFSLINLFHLEGSNDTALPHNRQAAPDHSSWGFYQRFYSSNIFLPKNIKLHNYWPRIRTFLPKIFSWTMTLRRLFLPDLAPCLYRPREGGEKPGGCSGWAPLSVGQSSGHTWRHLSLPIPTFQHRVVGENLGQGVSEKLPQGIRVSHTSIKRHVEHIQPAKDKEMPETVSARSSARYWLNSINQVLINYDQPGTDNVWSTSCRWNTNNQVQLRVNDLFLFYIHLLKLPRIYTFLNVF